MRNRQILYFATVFVWYCANAAYNFVLRDVAVNFESSTLVVFLTSILASQYFLLLVICYAKTRGQNTANRLETSEDQKSNRKWFVPISVVASLLGDVGTIGSYATSSVTLAQSVKCLEPLFLLVWNVGLRKKLFPFESIVGVLVVTSGVVVASWRTPASSLRGASLGILGAMGTTLRATLSSWFCEEGGCMFYLLFVNSAFLAVPLLVVAIIQLKIFMVASYNWLLAVPYVAILYTVYFISSYTVLLQSSPIHHGLLNMGKRGFVILGAALLHRELLNGRILIGTSITIVGMLMYAESRFEPDRRTSTQWLLLFSNNIVTVETALCSKILFVLWWTICTILTLLSLVLLQMIREKIIKEAPTG